MTALACRDQLNFCVQVSACVLHMLKGVRAHVNAVIFINMYGNARRRV